MPTNSALYMVWVGEGDVEKHGMKEEEEAARDPVFGESCPGPDAKRKTMSDTVSTLLLRNLHDVFEQIDPCVDEQR